MRQQDSQIIVQKTILYGIKHPESLSINSLLQNPPEVGVLYRYEHNIKIVGGTQYDRLLEMWAYPDGIKIYDANLSIINDKQPQNSFGQAHILELFGGRGRRQGPSDYIFRFVLTDYQLNRTYFTALCFHESLYVPVKQGGLGRSKNIYSKSLPKCSLWQLENDPLIFEEDCCLIYVPKVLMIGSKYPFFKFQKDMLKLYYRNVISNVPPPIVSQQLYQSFSQLGHLVGFPQAQVFFDKQTSYLLNKGKEKKQIESICPQIFFTSFLMLPQLNGQTIQVLDSKYSSVKVSALEWGNRCLSIPNIPIIEIIKRIGVRNLIFFWKSVILERKILIFSLNNLAVVQLFQVLLYLIRPASWQNIYIPFLPVHVMSHLQAPQDYLIGMSRIHLDYVIERYSEQIGTVILFDYDENIIIDNSSKTIPLPEVIEQMIITQMNNLGFKLEPNNKYTNLQMNQSADKERVTILRIKQIFFDGLIYLFNNYRNFANFNKQGLLSFNHKEYLKLFKDQIWLQFITEAIKTMVFVRLCELHLQEQSKIQWCQYKLQSMFVCCQNIISKKWPQTFWELPLKKDKKQYYLQHKEIPYHDYFGFVLQGDIEKAMKKRIYSVERYLIKYVTYLTMEKEIQQQSRTSDRQSERFYKMALQWLLPWLKQIQKQSKKQIKVKGVLQKKHQNLPILKRLFGNEVYLSQERCEQIKRIFQQSRDGYYGKNYFRQLKKKKKRNERASVI